MPEASIQSSVGVRGANARADVIVVQSLLLARGFIIGIADGICGDKTKGAIRTFQGGFMSQPDGRVDPGGKTWTQLNNGAKPSPVPAPQPQGGSLTRLIPKPAKASINMGLSAVNNSYMTSKLGNPRDSYSADCQPITNVRLKRNLLTASVGPFSVTGLKPAVLSLTEVMAAIRSAQPDVYAALGTAGMLCARWVRGSTTSISNHSWGCAVDLKLNCVLDARGDDKVQYGLTLIAPIFNKYGWYWGAGFATEDAMHFELSKGLLEGMLGQIV